MKWREGIFTLCPYCMSPRIMGRIGPAHKFHQCTELRRTKSHEYRCGCVIIEGEILQYTTSEFAFVCVDKVCPGAMAVLSKGLYGVINKWDLSTLTLFESAEKHAIEIGNLTAAAIHQAIRTSSMMQDCWRLPPIPCLDSHVKLVAKKSDSR